MPEPESREDVFVLCVFRPVCMVAPSASGSPPGRQYSPEALSGGRTADNPVCVRGYATQVLSR